MLCGIVLPIFSLTTGSFIETTRFDFIIDSFDIPKLSHYPVILLLGIAALFGQIYLTKAFSFQKTGVIGAVGYSNIVFSIIFGTFLVYAFPDKLSLVGITLIIICGILVSFKKAL